MTVETPPVATKTRARVRWGRVLLLALLVLGIIVGAFTAWAMGGSGGGQEVVVVVEEGASASQIATLLASKGVVRSAFMFRMVARVRGVGTDLRQGAYTMAEGMGVSAAIDTLLQGVPEKVERFTIPEGKTVIEIAEIIGRRTHISEDEFLAAARSGRHRIDLLPPGQDNVEGLLFPETYEIGLDATADEVVARLLRQFEIETAELDFSRAGRLGITAYEAVIIASMIEREARVADERRLISSVIYNRLRRPQRLEIDATVQYVILHRDGQYKHPLTFADYEIDSPYNTYQIDGVPPTPIASPGLASLRAALDPARTPYYYYRLANERGEHCFNETFEAHSRGCP